MNDLDENLVASGVGDVQEAQGGVAVGGDDVDRAGWATPNVAAQKGAPW